MATIFDPQAPPCPGCGLHICAGCNGPTKLCYDDWNRRPQQELDTLRAALLALRDEMKAADIGGDDELHLWAERLTAILEHP